MKQSKAPATPSINGHRFALGPGHSIAVYERDGEHYVAEFGNGLGRLTSAVSWFSFNAQRLRSPEGWYALQSFSDLDAETLGKIERLHAASDARQEAMLALPRRLAAALRDGLARAASLLRGPVSSRP